MASLPGQFQNSGPQNRFFRDEFRQDNGHFKGSVSGKADCLLVFGEDKKVSFME